jgi:hypothetical protein
MAGEVGKNYRLKADPGFRQEKPLLPPAAPVSDVMERKER